MAKQSKTEDEKEKERIYRESVGEKIRSLRVLRGFKQAEVAEQIKVTEKMYSRYELGLTLPPSDKILTLCEVLKTVPNCIFGFSEKSRMLNIIRKYDIRIERVAVKGFDRRRPLMPGSAIHLASAKVLMADWEARLHDAEEMICNAENEDALKQAKKEKERIKKERPTEEFLQRRDAQRAAAIEEGYLQEDERMDNDYICVLRPVLPDNEEKLLFDKEYAILPMAHFENILFNLQEKIDLLSAPGYELTVFKKLLYVEVLLSVFSAGNEFTTCINQLTAFLKDARSDIAETVPFLLDATDQETKKIIDDYYAEQERKRVKRRRIIH